MTVPVPADEAADDNEFIGMIASPDDVLVVVAGAANAGITTVAQPLGVRRRLPGRAEIRR